MKALGKLKKEPGIWMMDVDEPTPASHEVKIKIHQTAICGTDIHIYRWDDWAQATVPVPMVTGHEFSGVITELGDAVTGLEVGMRVSGEGHLVCGQCRNCRAGKQVLCPQTQGIGCNRPGCFGEYFVMPASNVFPLPDEVSDEVGAILDPMGNAVHTALSYDLVGEDVLITGAGPIGIMAVAIAKHAGARHVVISDVNDYRLDLARQMGATRAVNVTKESLADVMLALGMKEGFDVGLEMSGNETAFNTMVDLMISGGKIALLGIPPKGTVIDWHKVIFKSICIKGIYGREMYETWYKMISMLQSGLAIESVITHRFKVDDFQEAFALMDSGQSSKVLLDWT